MNKQQKINMTAAFKDLNELTAYRQILKTGLPIGANPSTFYLFPSDYDDYAGDDKFRDYDNDYETDKKIWNHVDHEFIANNYPPVEYCFDFLLSNMYLNYWIYNFNNNLVKDNDISRVCTKYNIDKKDFDLYRKSIKDNLKNDKTYKDYCLKLSTMGEKYYDSLPKPEPKPMPNPFDHEKQ